MILFGLTMGSLASEITRWLMSRTFDIACHDCRVKLWIGQAAEGKQYIYQTERDHKRLTDFLYTHQRHRLEFGDDEHMALDDYKSIGVEEDDAEKSQGTVRE